MNKKPEFKDWSAEICRFHDKSREEIWYGYVVRDEKGVIKKEDGIDSFGFVDAESCESRVKDLFGDILTLVN